MRFGYPLAEKLEEAGERALREKKDTGKREILIAPSWQEDNLLDSCIDQLIGQLYGDAYHITVRPHPEYSKRYGEKLKRLVEQYADRDPAKLTFELDFTVNKSIYSSDLLITDWSAIAYEFCYATKRPALFINTKMKCLNPNWQNLGLEPIEITLRNRVGVSLEKSELDKTAETVADLLSRQEEYRPIITDVYHHHLFHIGASAYVGASYILYSLKKRAEQKKASGK